MITLIMIAIIMITIASMTITIRMVAYIMIITCVTTTSTSIILIAITITMVTIATIMIILAIIMSTLVVVALIMIRIITTATNIIMITHTKRVTSITFIITSIIARGIRFFVIAALLRQYGEPLRDFIERRLGLMFTLFIVILLGGLYAVRFMG